MRLKYYLKGLGMGILFATVIMIVSCVIHNYNLSDEEIIKKAMQLGMIMPESETETQSGLFGDTDSQSEKESDSENDSESVNTAPGETEEPGETEKPGQTEEPHDTEIPSETETQKPSQDIVIEQYILHIVYGDMPKDVAKKLYDMGYVKSVKEFQYYLGDYCKAHSVDMRTGKFTITKGMTYEEIAKIITKNK